MSKLLKEGYLYKAHPRDGLFAVTVFQKRYFVLWSSGILEYYTSYQKLPEEYCSTMNLKETLDIVAPISVGRKHNIIRLSIKKNNRKKEYWLDCDCPSLLSEWLNCMISVAGLLPEDNDDCSNSPVTAANIANTDKTTRRLPSLPIIMDMEYEVPKSIDGEFYEEISPAGSPEINNNRCSLSRKYTPNINKIESDQLLKRAPITSSNDTTPSPTDFVTTSPTHTNTSPTPVPVNPMMDRELKKRLSFRRQEVYDSMTTSPTPVFHKQEVYDSMDDTRNNDEEEDTYEEVQFNTEVTVGERSNSKVNLRNKDKANNVIKPKSDNKHVKNAWSSTDNRPPLPVPPRDSVLFDLSSSDDPTQLPPVPLRSHSYSSGLDSASFYIDPKGRDSPQEAPPPVPERTNRADRRDHGVKSSQITTAIYFDQSGGSSNESSDQSGDATVIKGTVPIGPLGPHLLANVISNNPLHPLVKTKPAPPTTKPKPHPPPVARKPTINSSKVGRPTPLPKPAKGPAPPLAPKNRSHSYSPEIPPKSVVLPQQPSSRLGVHTSQLPPLPEKSLPELPPKTGLKDLPPKPMGNSLPPKPMGNSLPPKPMGNSLPPKPMGNSLPPKPMGNSLPPKPMGNSLPPKPMGNSLPPKPMGNSSPPKPMGNSSPPKPMGNSLPLKPKNYSQVKVGSFNNHKRPPMPLPKVK